MILGFKPQFKEPILKGTKKHSIRIDKHNRWIPGRQIQFATGVRTKKYNEFKEGWCRSTQSIEIGYKSDGNKIVWIDDYIFYCSVKTCKKCLASSPERRKQMLTLAQNDGFINIMHFFFWFNKDFTGKIIHFTDLKY
jgi:hypothetical protein